MVMFLVRHPKWFIFLNLFVLLEYLVMLMTLILVIKFLKQKYRYHKLRKAFSKFHRRHFDLVSKYNDGLKTFLLQGFRNLNCMATWVYLFRKKW